MSNVEVQYGKSAGDTATLLLAAAEESGEDASVVRTRNGAFLVPEAIAKKAGLDYDDPSRVGAPRVGGGQPKQEGDGSNAPKAEAEKPAKKSTAQKATAKKAAKKAPAKKSAAKKSTAKKS